MPTSWPTCSRTCRSSGCVAPAMRSRTLLLAALLPVAVAAGCGGGPAPPGPGGQRLMLNQGYSMLYKDMSRVELTRLILYIKVESEAVNTLVTAISEYSDALGQDLERIARDYPAVRIDLDPLPEMEKRKRADVCRQRALHLAPVIGRKGRSYERTLLLSLSAVLSQESHLCKVMAEEEPDPGLKRFLLQSEQRFEDLYGRVVALLDHEYFTGGRTAAGRT